MPKSKWNGKIYRFEGGEPVGECEARVVDGMLVETTAATCVWSGTDLYHRWFIRNFAPFSLFYYDDEAKRTKYVEVGKEA